MSFWQRTGEKTGAFLARAAGELRERLLWHAESDTGIINEKQRRNQAELGAARLEQAFNQVFGLGTPGGASRDLAAAMVSHAADGNLERLEMTPARYRTLRKWIRADRFRNSRRGGGA